MFTKAFEFNISKYFRRVVKAAYPMTEFPEAGNYVG